MRRTTTIASQQSGTHFYWPKSDDETRRVCKKSYQYVREAAVA